MNLPLPVRSAALARPDALALLDAATGERLTWAETSARVDALARAHAGRFGPGDVVGLLGPTGLPWALLCHALGALGAAVAPLPFGAPAPAVAAALRAAGAQPGGYAALLEVPATLAELDAVVQSDVNTDAAPPERFWPLDEVRAVVTTSGSTGAPRAVPLTTAQLAFAAFGSAMRLGHLPGDRWLLCLPPSAVGGLSILYRAAFGAAAVELHPAFRAEAVAAALVEGRCALVSLVPSMLAGIVETLEAAGERASVRVRAVLVGGAPTPPALVARAQALGLPLALTWGMSETAAQICTWEPGAYGTFGAGAPHAFARVEAAPGGDRLRVRGPVAPGGDLLTGDAGRIDAQGRVQPVARLDDVLNSGGAKIAPAEVEAVLCTHADVAEVAVVGGPDPHYGQRPVAFVVLRAGATADAAALRAHAKAHLARHKVPAEPAFHFLSETDMPRGPTGKVDRRALSLRAASAALGDAP